MCVCLRAQVYVSFVYIAEDDVELLILALYFPTAEIIDTYYGSQLM